MIASMYHQRVVVYATVNHRRDIMLSKETILLKKGGTLVNLPFLLSTRFFVSYVVDHSSESITPGWKHRLAVEQRNDLFANRNSVCQGEYLFPKEPRRFTEIEYFGCC